MRISLGFTLASAIVFLCEANPPAAAAQTGRTAAAADRASGVVQVSRRWFDNPARAGELAGRILATGAPSTYQVISIAIPDQLPRRGEGRVEIVARDGFTILGTRKWSLAALAGKNKVIAIVGIPANAHAGLMTAADVRFYVAGAPTVSLSIEIDISLLRELAVRLHSAPLRARAGGRLTFSYELVNSGNATESPETSVTSPRGWKTTQRSGASVVVEPGESVGRQVVVTVPRDAGTGSFFLRLDVLSAGVVRSSIPVAVEVVDGLSRQASAGPEITIAVARAIDASGRGNTITTTSVRGPLFDSVRIDARFSSGATDLAQHSQALSRLGAYRMTPTLVLSAPAGRLALGAAGRSFTDLTGLYAFGRGAAIDLHRQGWHLIGLGAMSNASPSSGKSQPLLGLRGDVDVGPIRLMSSLSHLRGGDQSGRQLDAAGFGATVDAGLSTTLQGEVARRRFAGGSGTGWSGEIARGDSRNRASVRVTRAPGGSEAFARAVSEVVANVTQTLSRRLNFSGSTWRSSDATAAFARLVSSGWAIRPEYRIHSSTTIALEAHSTELSASTTAGQFGSAGDYGGAERQIGVSVNANVRQLYVSGSVAGGSVSRTVGKNAATSSKRGSPRLWWNSMASWRGSNSVVELQGRMEEMRDLAGAVKRQSQLSLRGSQSLPSSTGRAASADWEVQQIRGYTARPTTVVRAGVTLPVTTAMAVKLYAERNPLFTSSAGQSPWTYALRIEHSTRVPMVRAPGTSGYVYRDLNGNQKRDDGEPGVDGAVVGRGSGTAVTDANGRYRLAGNTRLPIVLDEASLPLGLVRETTGSPDIAVGSSLSAEIRFFVAPRSAIDAVEVDLSELRAIARDASGREWVGRMTAPTVAVFDGLPPGSYTLELDLTGVAEPLIPRVPLPLLRVTPFEPSFVTVILDPRPLRIWRAEPVAGQSAPREITAPAGSGGVSGSVPPGSAARR